VLAATPENGLALEAGCGSGTLSLALARRGRRVVSLDISHKVLANLNANRDGLTKQISTPLRISTCRGDLERLPFADDVFDAAVNEGVIEHWVDREARRAVLSEMKRVVKPGGVVVVFVPNGKHPLAKWWQWTRYPGYISSASVPWHRYDCRELAADLEAVGLLNVRTDGISPYSTIAVWPNWWILRALAAVLRRLLPEPAFLRKKYGFNLVGWGTV